jgi:hypothetical protein
MPLLAYVHCNFHPDVGAYLSRRYNNEVKLTEVLPACPVTTGLLIALHHTAHGKNDLVDQVIEMDTHMWLNVSNMASEEEQAAAVKRCRKALQANITNTLGKVHGKGSWRTRRAKDNTSTESAAATSITSIHECLRSRGPSAERKVRVERGGCFGS